MTRVPVKCSVCGKVLSGRPRSDGFEVSRHNDRQGKRCDGQWTNAHKPTRQPQEASA